MLNILSKVSSQSKILWPNLIISKVSLEKYIITKKYIVLTNDQLNREKLLSKITLYENARIIKPEYQGFIQKKIDNIENELKLREKEEIKASEYKFIGLPSYDLRVFLSYFFLKYYF